MAVKRKTRVTQKSKAGAVNKKKEWEVVEWWETWQKIVALGLLLVLFWYRTNSWPIVAVVDGVLVTRFELNQLMYAKVGPDALESLVMDTLISKELERKNVKISASEVEARLAEIKKQVGSEESFSQALAFQGMTELQLKGQIRTQIGLEKLVEPSTDSAKLQQEVSDYVQNLRTKAKVWIVSTSGQK